MDLEYTRIYNWALSPKPPIQLTTHNLRCHAESRVEPNWHADPIATADVTINELHKSWDHDTHIFPHPIEDMCSWWRRTWNSLGGIHISEFSLHELSLHERGCWGGSSEISCKCEVGSAACRYVVEDVPGTVRLNYWIIAWWIIESPPFSMSQSR